MGVNTGIQQKGHLGVEQAKLVAFASATGSLLSLSFVYLVVHILRLLVGTKRRARRKLYRRWNTAWYKALRGIKPKLAA
jgi:hypothetical protein